VFDFRVKAIMPCVVVRDYHLGIDPVELVSRDVHDEFPTLKPRMCPTVTSI
jgi:hypothetical protein